MKEYSKAKKMGEKNLKQGQLLVLDETIDAIDRLDRSYLGCIDIPTNRIVGTKTRGRVSAFAPGFMPILSEDSEFAMKWENLYDSQLAEGIRDPIQVFEYRRLFYVQEGNKRVSVAKYVGMPSMRAHVTRILPEKKDETQIDHEYVDFYAVTQINDLYFTQVGSYIAFAKCLNKDLTHPWDLETIAHVRSAFHLFCSLYPASYDVQSDVFLLACQLYGLDGAKDKEKIQRLLSGQSVQQEWIDKPEMYRKVSLFNKKYSVSYPLRIAFIADSSMESSTWIHDHELGRLYMETYFGGVVRTHMYDGKMEDIVPTIAKQIDIVISISPRQLLSTYKLSLEYPSIHFMNCSVLLQKTNVHTFYSRLYEAKFLLGMIAASMSQTHCILYQSEYPIYGDIPNINAFAIGAGMIDPQAKVYLDWSYASKDVLADVISGPDSICWDNTSREFGIYQKQGDTIVNLAMPIVHWGKYYVLLIQHILDRGEKAVRGHNNWWGMDSGIIDLIISEHVPYPTQNLIYDLKQAMIKGNIHPFDGEIHSQKGLIRHRQDARWSQDEIIQMHWLNENVIGGIPQ
jgi:basic membrane lipoprotein Med (substrate-binding protein (PBP1-ABC) superfamily)